MAPKRSRVEPVNLPVLVVSAVDVGRLIRELEAIDNALLQLGLRAGGSPVELPKTSQLMDQIGTAQQTEFAPKRGSGYTAAVPVSGSGQSAGVAHEFQR